MVAMLQPLQDPSKRFFDQVVVPPSYLIFKVGNVIYAKNGLTGQIEFSGTDAGTVIQSVINALPDGGKIFFKRGFYEITSDVVLPIHRTFIFEGEGSRYYRYNINQTVGNTILYFDGADFKDNGDGVWNDGWVYFVAKHLTIAFNGNASTGKGLMSMRTTLPYFTDVALYVKGTYRNNTIILFGRGVGPVGKTGIFHGVTVDASYTSGNYVTVLRVNFDTFIWDGGAILTNLGSEVFDSRLVRLEATQSARVSQVSTYRDDRRPVSWFWLTPMDAADIPYEFEGIYFYGSGDGSDVNYHFTSTEGMVKIRLRGVQSTSGTLKFNNVAPVEKSGSATINAGGTYVDVMHGLPFTPDINRIKVVPKDNLDGRSFWVSDVGATTFRINISLVDTVDHVFGWSYE
ncbi:MAG: hypothetical protein QXK12_08465 [Candidatus Nezhaarchaeales archaeon]